MAKKNKKKITPWKNTGKKSERSNTLFRISWDVSESRWVPDPKGHVLGFYSGDETYFPVNNEAEKWVKDPRGRFVGFYDKFGNLVRAEERKGMNLSAPDLELGTPSLGVVEEKWVYCPDCGGVSAKEANLPDGWSYCPDCGAYKEEKG